MIERFIEEDFEPLTPRDVSSSPIHRLLYSDYDSLSDSVSPTQDSPPGADHWTKFEMDFPELCKVDDVFLGLDCRDSSYPFIRNEDAFLHHDCMWAGHCLSKEHAEEARYSPSYLIPLPPSMRQEMTPVTPKPTTNGQQSLLKPSVKAAAAAAAASTTTVVPNTGSNIIKHSPQTPPESDDEESKTNNPLLKILNDAINEWDLVEDRELSEYFEDENVEVKEEQIDIEEHSLDYNDDFDDDIKSEDDTESEQDEKSDRDEYRTITQMAAENDHSYHKEWNAAVKTSFYGIDTPSESEEEEEIDVVSVNSSTTDRMALSLPTNPSSTDQHHLQRRMATVMSRNQASNGIKTILPVRASSSTSPTTTTPSPRNSGRGVKRGRGARTNAGYKRRRTANEGISREPCDKRHLHNDMERQRRVDLSIAFAHLKSLVPEVSGSKKAAKVNILMQASHYCYYLTGTNSNNVKQLDELKERQVWLRSRLSQLRRNLAARR